MVSPLISVIVPVYNTEKYLPQCIESILAQTFTDFELLLIDDGSPDRCGEICEEYAQRDRRIRVFHQRNKGVSAARNLGLENVRGKYIAFVDADDYVLPDYLKDLFDTHSNDNQNSLIIHTVIKCCSNELMKQYDLPEAEFEKQNVYQFFNDYAGKDIGYSVAKLFDYELIRSCHVRFPEYVSLLEDLFFLFDYVQNVSSIKICNVANYIYRIGYSDTALSVAYKPLSEELCIFRIYYDYIKGFIQSSGLPSDRFHGLWCALRIYFHRILLVLYAVKERKYCRERIACLKRLRSEYSDWIVSYFNPDYKADKVTAFFLKIKWYNCVDFWMRFLLGIRFKKMFGVKKV